MNHTQSPSGPNPYRGAPLPDLRDEARILESELRTIVEETCRDPYSWRNPIGSMDFALVALANLNREIARQERIERIRKSPELGAWSERRFRNLIDLAAALKAAYPLPIYCRDVLGIDLQRSGRNHLVGSCPFWHESKSGRCFSVSIDRDLYRCWSCGRHGDVIALHGEVHRLDGFRATVLDLARTVGIGGAA